MPGRRAVCPEGHTLLLDETPSSRRLFCPDCRRDVDVILLGSQPADDEIQTAPEPTPRGLWALMGRTPAASPGSEQPETTLRPPPSLEATQTSPAPLPPAAAEDEAPRPRGLWSIMSPAERPASAPPPVSEPPAELSPPEPPALPEAAPGDEPKFGAPAVATLQHDPSLVPLPSLALAPAATPHRALLRSVRSGRSRAAVVSCLLGLGAIPFSGLSALPELWLRLPATVLGFAALLMGLLSHSEIRRSKGRQTGERYALGGVLLGTLAMFLGPLVFAGLGTDYRDMAARRETLKHLEAIGEGLRGYYAEHDHFPPGGVFTPDEQGKLVGTHGWMTTLLPYLGREELYRSLDLTVPYDAPPNAPAMKREIEEFYAAGADRRRTPRGFAVAHFAGVGGSIRLPEGGLAHAGIFDENSAVRIADITDGRSQTLVAGEIAFGFSSWGDPNNWRNIGRGLNQDPFGFGNADNTGAVFLKADGSVQFYPNRTSPDVLRRLSTRDAGDNPL